MRRLSSFVSLLSFYCLVSACGPVTPTDISLEGAADASSPDASVGSASSGDAGSADVGRDANVADATAQNSRDAAADASNDVPVMSIVGAWERIQESAQSRARFVYWFHANGKLTAHMTRVDVDGAYAGCLETKEAEGTWVIDGSRLDVTILSGTSERGRAESEVQCGSGADLAYPSRPLTDEERLGLDFASGPYRFDGDRLVTITYHGVEQKYQWFPLAL